MIGPARRKPLISNNIQQISRNYRQQTSPTKASILLRTDCSEYVNSLKAKKQNYTTALGLYSACYQHQLPQKCLKHLNYITLYCGDQHKLLCVNCLYGSTVHKNHSVTPSNSSLPSIRIDNQTNIHCLNDQIIQIKEAQKIINQNKRIIQSQNNYIISQLTKQFDEIRRMIDNKQKQLKQRVKIQFQRASHQNQLTRRQIGWWNQQMNKIKNNLPQDSNTQDSQIYKHLVLQLMLNQKIQTQKLTFIASKDQMEHQFLTQARQLKQQIRNKVVDNCSNNQIRLF